MKLKKWIFFVGLPAVLAGAVGLFYFFRSVPVLENGDNRTLEMGLDGPSEPPPGGSLPQQGCERDPHFYQLLKDSPFLHQQNVQIFAGEGQSTGIRVPKVCEGPWTGPFFALTSEGLLPVSEAATGEGTLQWGCGGTLAAKVFLFNGGLELAEKSASLFVVGENAEKVLQWHPAKETEESHACGDLKNEWKLDLAKSYQFVDLPWKYRLEVWRENRDPNLAHSLTTLSVVEKKTCTETYRTLLDGDGMATDKEESLTVIKVLGLLTLKMGSENENWLVLETVGYESSAYSIAPVDSSGKMDLKRMQSLAFAGC